MLKEPLEIETANIKKICVLMIFVINCNLKHCFLSKRKNHLQPIASE